MKLGIVVYSADAETAWNAFRVGTRALEQADRVSVFLLGKGVDSERLDTALFNVSEQMTTFVETGGDILACGTCLKFRQTPGSELCPVFTMSDLYAMIHDSDRVLTF